MTDILLHNPIDELVRIGTTGLSSENTRRCFARGLRNFLSWAAGRSFDSVTVKEYRAHLQSAGCGPATINQAISAIRRLATELHDAKMISESSWSSVKSVRSVKPKPSKAGNWLDKHQIEYVLNFHSPTTPNRGKRDRAILVTLATTALRREEVAGLRCHHLRKIANYDVLADFQGKGAKLGTVRLNSLCAEFLEDWIAHAQLNWDDPIFPVIDNPDTITRKPTTGKRIYDACMRYSAATGIEFAPHDFRRSFTMLAKEAGADIDDISASLRHEDVKTTRIYMRSPMAIVNSPVSKIVLNVRV